MLTWLRYLLGLVVVGLITVDYWLTFAFAGVIAGTFVALIWAFGNAQQTIEYWRGTCPRWMTRFFGQPHQQKILKISIRQNHVVAKIVSLILGIMGTTGFIVASIESNSHVLAAILFPSTWIMGTCLSEIYFRRKYTRVTDWSSL